MRPTRSPKFSSPTASPPRMTVKFSHDRNVRSLAKKTFGSTRVGRAMRLPGIGQDLARVVAQSKSNGAIHTWRGLKKRLARHFD